MLKNYLTTAWRNIKRNKINSIINIGGLAIGMSCVIFIALYVQDELSYDKFFKSASHIFQVNMSGLDNGVPASTGNTAPAVAPTMTRLYPEIETYVRIYRPGDVMVRYDQTQSERYFTEKRMMAVDSNFLQVFDYPFLQGDPATCLQKTNALVITEQTAKKYFGSANAIGKILSFDIDKKPFVVTGVLKDIPSQSSFQFDMLAPIAAYGEVKKRSWNWFWLQVTSYVKLKDKAAVSESGIRKLEAEFPAMVKKYTFRSEDNYKEFVAKGGQLSYHLMPLTDVHLHANPAGVPARLTTLSDIKYVYIFSAVAFFVIMLACVNFMNLSTAQSTKRAKEVGIRKVLGSLKTQLIRQFLSEAILYSLIALILSIVIVLVLLKPFNILTGKSLMFASIFYGNIWLFLLVLCLLTGLFAGLYPAFYLTSFNPVTVLKGIRFFKNNFGDRFIRNGLVIFQFTTSIVLIICTAIVFKQLRYAQTKDLGLNKDHVVVISNTDKLKNKEESFRQELTKLTGVTYASISSSFPPKGSFGDGYVPEQAENDMPLMKEIGLSSFLVDDDFIPTFQMKVLNGRNFSKEYSDSASVIINETAANMIGWKNPVGKYLDYPGNDQKFKVIAVVKDFSVASLHTLVEPFALFHKSSNTYNLGHSYISVRFGPGNMDNYLRELKLKWENFTPSTPFDYSFLDSEFESLYRSEQRMGAVFSIFTFLSIFVACLGLFGLSVYTIERRTKEIGVRKVLGASVQNVVVLVSKDFLKLVLLAALIAFPLAWFAMNKWLEDFAYRTNIGWMVFLLSAFAAVFIAIGTISFQAIKAAISNPVNSLRSE